MNEAWVQYSQSRPLNGEWDETRSIWVSNHVTYDVIEGQAEVRDLLCLINGRRVWVSVEDLDLIIQYEDAE